MFHVDLPIDTQVIAPTIVQYRPRLVVRPSYDYVRPVCDQLRSVIPETSFFNMFKNLFATDFDRESVYDHHDQLHDLSAIFCDLTARLVVQWSQPGRKACVIGALNVDILAALLRCLLPAGKDVISY